MRMLHTVTKSSNFSAPTPTRALHGHETVTTELHTVTKSSNARLRRQQELSTVTRPSQQSSTRSQTSTTLVEIDDAASSRPTTSSGRTSATSSVVHRVVAHHATSSVAKPAAPSRRAPAATSAATSTTQNCCNSPPRTTTKSTGNEPAPTARDDRRRCHDVAADSSRYATFDTKYIVRLGVVTAQLARHLQRDDSRHPSRRCHSSVGTPPSTRRLSSSVSALSQLSWHATFNATTLVVRLGAVTAQLARHLRRDDSLSVSVRYCSSGNSTPCPSRASSMERSWHAPRRHVHRAPQLQPTHHLRRDAHRPS